MAIDLTSLPPVGQDEWDAFTSQRFEQTTNDRINSLATQPTAPTASTQAPGMGFDPSNVQMTIPTPDAAVGLPVQSPGMDVGDPGLPSESPASSSFAAQTDSRINALDQVQPGLPPNRPELVTGNQTFTPTTAEISGAAQGSGRFDDNARSIMTAGAGIASWLGDQGQRALQAILVTEGGMGGAVGDTDRSSVGSHGPLQFYGSGGQLNNFADQHNMSVSQAAAYVKANPLEAIQWAIGTPDRPGYLGGAIQRGIQMGLSGPALATFAQQHGQVSESPERAGANYNALFGGGSGLVSGGSGIDPTGSYTPSATASVSQPDPINDPWGWLNAQKDELVGGISDAGQRAASAVSRAGQGDSSMFPEPAPQPAQPEPSVWDKIGTGIADVFRSAFGGQQASPVPAPGGGYDPSHMQATTATAATDTPLRQDVRDLGQPAQPTVLDQAGQAVGGAFDALGTGVSQAAPGIVSDLLTPSQNPNETGLQDIATGARKMATEGIPGAQQLVDLSMKYGSASPDETWSQADRNLWARAMTTAISGMVNPEAAAFGAGSPAIRRAGAEILTSRQRAGGELGPLISGAPDLPSPHGFAVPDPGYVAGTPEHTTEQLLRRRAQEQGTRTPNLTQEDIQSLPGLSGSHLTNLQEVRDAVDAGLPSARWYEDIVGQIKTDTGQTVNPREAQVLMGAFGGNAGVTANYHAMLSMFDAMRQAQPNLTGFENMSTLQILGHPEFGRVRALMAADKVYASPDQIAAVMKGYRTGEVIIPSGPKLSSYTQSFLAAQEEAYNPFTAQDVWQGRIYGSRVQPLPVVKGGVTQLDKNGQPLLKGQLVGPDVAASDPTYRSMHTLNNWIARELDLKPRETQSAAWVAMRTVWNDPVIGPKLRTGEKTMGEAIKEGVAKGLFANLDNLAEVTGRSAKPSEWDNKILAVRDRIRANGSFDMAPPPSATAVAQMELRYPGQGMGVRVKDLRQPVDSSVALARRDAATAQGPVLRVPGAIELDESGRIPWLQQDHTVQTVGPDTYVSMTGVGDPAAEQISLRLGGNAYNHASPEVSTIGGFTIEPPTGVFSSGDQDALVRALRSRGVPAVPSQSGGFVRVPSMDGDTRALHGIIQTATQEAGVADTRLTAYQGVTHAIEPTGPGATQGIGSGRGTAGPSDLPAGSDRGYRASEASGGSGPAGLPAQALAQYGSTLGGGAAGGVTTAANTDENDPNRLLKIAGGTLAGAAAGYGAARIAENPALLRTRQRAGGFLGNEPPTPLSAEEAQTLAETLSQRWQALDEQATELFDRSAAANNPGRIQQLENQAQRVRDQQAEIMRIADYVDEHGSLPPQAAQVDIGSTIPKPIDPPPSAPTVGIDDASLRQQSHVFGETQAAKKRAQLPLSGTVLPEGARPIDTTRVAEIKRLRLEQWPEEMRDTIQRAAEARDFGKTQRRGVVADVVSEGMADNLGRTFDEWVKGGKAGKAYNAEELRALRNAMGAQAASLNQISTEVGVARTAGNLTDNLLIRQFAEGQKLQALTQVLEGATAEWGRAGRAFQGAARLIDLPPDEATVRIYKMLGGRDNALAAIDEYQKLLATHPNDVIAQAKFWAGVKNPPAGMEDWFRLLRYNSMLSGPRTLEVNVIGNALELPWRLGRDVLASTIRGNPRELAPEMAGMAAGFAKGRTKFLQVLTDGITTEAALAGDLPRNLSDRVKNPVAKTLARFLEPPGRAMQGLDEWAHAMANEMALGRRAGVTATKEGLKGKVWDARVAELLAAPTAGMQKEALGIADRMTYRGEMGTLGRALEQVQKVPYLGAVVLPFLRTVYHIAARGIDRSPLGLIGTGIDVARGVYGPRMQLGRALAGETVKDLPKGVVPLGERLGDNLIGSAFTIGFYHAAIEGNISGAGPDDAEKRDMLRAQGWQPYSVRLGGQWVSYSNWGPVAMSLSMAAAAAEAQTYRKSGADVGGMLLDATRRTAELATEQSYLSGIGAVWKGLAEPDRYGARFVGQFVTSLLPYGSTLNTIGQATDTEGTRTPSRENFGEFLGQSVAARLPGLRTLVPLAQDQLGRPVPNEASGLGAVNPLRTSTIRSNAVLQEMLANGADVGDPPKSYDNIPLKADEQRRFNEAAGRNIERAVTRMMAREDYQRMSVVAKKAALQTAVQLAREAAGDALLETLGRDEISRRLTEDRAKRVPVPIGR